MDKAKSTDSARRTSHSALRTPHSAPGFTLVELLVAMSLFAVLMSGVVMLFIGSVRSAQTSYQQIDAFEKARSALTVVQNDLVTGFSSHQNSDLHTFYGTPIGMTFIGLAPTSTGSGNFNVARITYVVYNRVVNRGELVNGGDLSADSYQYRFPEAMEDPLMDINGVQINLDGVLQFNNYDGYPYPLLKYVETGASDLNAFPIPWTERIPDDSMTYGDVLNGLLQKYDCIISDNPLTYLTWDMKILTDEQREMLWTAKCEMWIRMLAGGDTAVPVDFWTDLHPSSAGPMDPLDYMVADNILSRFPPNRVTESYPPGFQTNRQPIPNNPGDNRRDSPFCGTLFFDYDMAASFTDRLDPNNPGNKFGNFWWNDARSNAIHLPNADGTPFKSGCSALPDYTQAIWDVRLPEAVTMNFWLMFESPYPGAPDFQRYFSLQINIPAAYARPTE